jgi:NAD(P)-dependent dehydrogenase (short-subunit alcohol dehydrogenase family)
MTQIKLKPIQDQVVVVVGASSGIGRETARQFAQRGAKVVASSRSIPGLTTLVDEITQFGGEAIAVPADVADFDQVNAIASKAVEVYGRIDSWVHLAATGIISPFEKIEPGEFKRAIDINLMGQVYGAMVALPHLRQTGGGALIHVTSVEARRSLPLQSAYASAKHGVEGFIESLRVELRHEGVPISVTNVLPATINTPFYNKALTKLGVKPTGVPPYYQPSLVAEAILHVAEHPTRDIIVGDAGRVLDFLQKLSPQLLDTVLQFVAVEGQYTKEPEAEGVVSGLYEPVADERYDRVRGDYDDKAIPSFLDWFDFHPALKWGTIAGLGAVAFLAAQVLGEID